MPLYWQVGLTNPCCQAARRGSNSSGTLGPGQPPAHGLTSSALPVLVSSLNFSSVNLGSGGSDDKPVAVLRAADAQPPPVLANEGNQSVGSGSETSPTPSPTAGQSLQGYSGSVYAGALPVALQESAQVPI